MEFGNTNNLIAIKQQKQIEIELIQAEVKY